MYICIPSRKQRYFELHQLVVATSFNLPSLNHLDSSQNELSLIPGDFTLPQLRLAFLIDNPITLVPDSLCDQEPEIPITADAEACVNRTRDA